MSAMEPGSAIEFFSGIGAFAKAAEEAAIDVINAFDQSIEANRVYSLNFGLNPAVRNLDTIRAADIPPADIWWMSPPCKPYTVRGEQRDNADSRARSLANLISLVPVCKPKVLLLENVRAFEGSNMHARLLECLTANGYAVDHLRLCSSMFGVPMRRPRVFVLALHNSSGLEFRQQPVETVPQQPLISYLDRLPDERLYLEAAVVSQYEQGFDIIREDDENGVAICFTSGYARCMRASGSMLRDTTGRIRRFSPAEMLRLFGFSGDFNFPADLQLSMQWRLIGNSVDLRSVRHVLASCGLLAK